MQRAQLQKEVKKAKRKSQKEDTKYTLCQLKKAAWRRLGLNRNLENQTLCTMLYRWHPFGPIAEQNSDKREKETLWEE